jgi:hypothetical protein
MDWVGGIIHFRIPRAGLAVCDFSRVWVDLDVDSISPLANTSSRDERSRISSCPFRY